MHLNTFSMASFSISSSFTFTCLKIFCLIGQDKRLKHINGKLGRPVSMSTYGSDAQLILRRRVVGGGQGVANQIERLLRGRQQKRLILHALLSAKKYY